MALSPIGALPARTYTALATLIDVTGYAGVWVVCGPSTNDNMAITLGWDITVGASTFAISNDVVQVPSISGVGSPDSVVAKWFPAKGQKLSVGAAGNTATTYDGTLLVIPTTTAFGGQSHGVWTDPTVAGNLIPGLLASINQNIPAHTAATVFLKAPFWGKAQFQWASIPGAVCQVDIKGYDFMNNQQHFQAYSIPTGLQTAPVDVIIPAACYTTIDFLNNAAGAFNPLLNLVGDLTSG